MQLAQLAFYVNRTINNGLTRARALEVMTQLALYTGWSTTFTALPIVKSVVDKRRNQVFRSKSPSVRFVDHCRRGPSIGHTLTDQKPG
nr:hypothetical protein [Paraburkholderia terrae]